MKLTKDKLRQIIKEELEELMSVKEVGSWKTKPLVPDIDTDLRNEPPSVSQPSSVPNLPSDQTARVDQLIAQYQNAPSLFERYKELGKQYADNPSEDIKQQLQDVLEAMSKINLKKLKIK